MQRHRLPYLLIPLAALIVVFPLLFNGCSCGHDFDFHLLNWFEAANQFAHGNLHPHWAYTAAYNAGEPRFVFYPPASWTLGAILGLLLPWTWAPILYTWIALTASGLTLYRLARDFASPTAALLASAFYLANPYMLFTAYERTAYAELLAAAWIPLLLHGILRRQITIPRIAIPIALLWLTNAPAAVMSCYALALLAAIRLATTPAAPGLDAEIPATLAGLYLNPQKSAPSGAPYLDSEMSSSRESATAPAHANPAPVPSQSPARQTLTLLAGTALGLSLAAAYIVPAAHQRRFVQIAMAILPGMRIQDNFLFHHTTDLAHNEVLHTASLIAVLLLILTAAALLAAHRATGTRPPSPDLEAGESPEPQPSAAHTPGSHTPQPTPTRPQRDRQKKIPTYLLLSLAILTAAIALLLTPITNFVWQHAPELAFLQFPWRLLAILATVLSLCAAVSLRSLHLKPALTAAIAISLTASLTWPAYTLFHQPCDPEDTVSARLTLFHSHQGSEPTDEYTPAAADNDSLAPANPPYWLSSNPDAKAPADAIPGPAPARLTLNSPTPQFLILNLRNYPAWRLTLNQSPIPRKQQDQYQRDDGLIALPIPAGPSTLTSTYTQTRDQTTGDILTLLSLALLLLLCRTRPSNPRQSSEGAIASARRTPAASTPPVQGCDGPRSPPAHTPE